VFAVRYTNYNQIATPVNALAVIPGKVKAGKPPSFSFETAA